MKLTTFFVVAAISYNLAQACLGEAQIIANVQEVRSLNPEIDLVFINSQTVSFYQENRTCPLDLSEVLHNGINVKNNYLHHGSTLSGVVVKAQDGRLILE